MAKAIESRAMLVATESFTGGLEDGSIFSALKDRTRVWSDHPAVKRWPGHFAPIAATSESPARPEVEAATANPGEKRGAS